MGALCHISTNKIKQFDLIALGEEPHIGKYRLLKTIGKGNFAKVKLAKHLPTGKEVIIINSFHNMFFRNVLTCNILYKVVYSIFKK